MQGKERAGIERTIMTNIFALGKLNDTAFRRFISLVIEQSTYFDTFNQIAKVDLKKFTQSMQHDSVTAVKEFRNIALQSNGIQAL